MVETLPIKENSQVIKQKLKENRVDKVIAFKGYLKMAKENNASYV